MTERRYTPRPTPAQLARHHCGLGHRLAVEMPDNYMLGRVLRCVDCGARTCQDPVLGQRWQVEFLPWNSGKRPPCAAKEE